ncbi:ATP-dependent DNA helicase RecG [Aeoliella mucimassa]|uniref:ATP-dependent DNA helicase RecG n=1 Tax=Aeoliella mucimassa TaxID=2527972 RepID=A0A518AI72_9BACT|nr:ATP-dependent DNA helicase RecG [Aeoliella mucimassa]QDU54427.1 ATP-dependent DNA helicase RecG [Aeoliella mucimassa]
MTTPVQILATPVAEAVDVRPPLKRPLAKLGLRTVRDVLFNFPRDYEDLSDLRGIEALEEDVLQTVRGTVEEVDSRSIGFGKTRVGVLIADRGFQLRATWFNQPFMRDKFKVGDRVQFSAKPKQRGGRWEMTHPHTVWLGDEFAEADQQSSTSELQPVYSLSDGITQFHMRRIAGKIVSEFAEVPDEVFSAELLAKYKLPTIHEALKAIHLPENREQVEQARRRFIFQELFVLQLALAARRHQQRVNFTAPELPVTAQIDARISRLLPFQLTAGQREAVEQIADDLSTTTPMNRLLQGDVGSGKTLVAVYALLVCVAHGYQAALMAPTEILARQHSHTLEKLLDQSRVRYQLLVGGLKPNERQEVLRQMVEGETDLVIGTHALLQEKVQFKNLGLVVIDEQHKFGVEQRASLRRGDRSPHYLVMTATPIPRTMGMTQFGDLDVSTLHDMPPGRQPVTSYVVGPGERERWWEFTRNKLREGRQAFVVTPLVEESENIAATSVDQAFEQLTSGELADFRVDILHGRMTPAEKDEVMERFRQGETQVLVATTVIEVGVDVPNASMMIIASPERFGIAQLHQLRGRVGRGKHAGFCAVLVDDETSDDARARLQKFADTHSGFELAEVDFAIRGPGDLFGTRQHGLPPLLVADLVRDGDVLVDARDAAIELFQADPGLSSHAKLRSQMLRKYGDALDLSDVG